MKVIILDKVESLHMYKNIFGKHRIEVRTISGETTKINSDSETGALEKFNTINYNYTLRQTSLLSEGFFILYPLPLNISFSIPWG